MYVPERSKKERVLGSKPFHLCFKFCWVDCSLLHCCITKNPFIKMQYEIFCHTDVNFFHVLYRVPQTWEPYLKKTKNVSQSDIPPFSLQKKKAKNARGFGSQGKPHIFAYQSNSSLHKTAPLNRPFAAEIMALRRFSYSEGVYFESLFLRVLAHLKQITYTRAKSGSKCLIVTLFWC